MNYIDPHIHCVSRTTDDYQFMQPELLDELHAKVSQHLAPEIGERLRGSDNMEIE